MMQLEDVLVDVVEQQVCDWCAKENWDIKARTESSITMDNDQLTMTLEYNVVVPGPWLGLEEPEEHELKVTSNNDENDVSVIYGWLEEMVVFSFPVHQIEIETTGPYTNW